MNERHWVLLAAAAWLATAFAAPANAAPRDTTKLSPGATFTECSHCPEMVVIPAGRFVMGTPEAQENHEKDEYQHEVTIAKPFALSKTEVTWDQWEACVRDGACDGVAVETALRLDREGNPDPNYKDWGRGSNPGHRIRASSRCSSTRSRTARRRRFSVTASRRGTSRMSATSCGACCGAARRRACRARCSTSRTAGGFRSWIS